MEVKRIDLRENGKANLTAYLHSESEEIKTVTKRPAVLILPGGAYYMCSDREAEPVAFCYLRAGYQVFILRYTVGIGTVWPEPLEDYELAMKYIRSNADLWKIYPERIAVIGFSAGGHLAACAAAMGENRPDAAILGYPVINKKCVGMFLSNAPDAAAAVDDKTCPCFVFAGCNDTAVPVQNALEMVTALAKHDITFESHIYAYASHGFSVCTSELGIGSEQVCSRTPHWIDDSIEWLKDIFGDFGETGMTEPGCGRRINGNHEPYYNLDCTINFLMQDGQVKQLLDPYFKPFLNAMHTEEIPAPFAGLKLREMLASMQMPPESVKNIEASLKTILKERGNMS